jgi:hypothetical protein
MNPTSPPVLVVSELHMMEGCTLAEFLSLR